MTAGPEPAIDRTRNDRADQRPHGHAPPQHSSTMSSIMVMAVSLICGAVGAMGYSYFLGPKSSEPSSQSESNAASGNESGSRGGSGRTPGAESATNSSAAASPEESGDLKQQIMSLNKRIDRLGERVDRLQELMSLAVPLLQRLAPKQ